MIKQIINTHQQIQTGLAVEVNGRRIDYEPLNDTFGYKQLKRRMLLLMRLSQQCVHRAMIMEQCGD